MSLFRRLFNISSPQAKKTYPLAAKFPHLPEKQLAEIQFWSDLIEDYVSWYEGKKELYGRECPAENFKVTSSPDLRENAIRTWVKACQDRYQNALGIDAHYFPSGSSVLDIGCGPLPHLIPFENIQRYGVDQLITEYKAVGYPLDKWDPPVNYLTGSSDSIPAEENSFDAIVSVNAIDHVDDFESTAKEIIRVLRPGGILRMQIHYHPPTICEPHELNDEVVLRNFGVLGIKKLSERPAEISQGGFLTVWSTTD